MYQSLHTTVIGPEGRPLEVQIRTHQMHRTAEYGIAAHWRYKEQRGSPRSPDEKAEIAWLGRMLEWQKEMSDPREFMAGLKIDLYEGQVGARIGGRLVPLDYELQTGDAVEVLTSKAPDAGPKQDWLAIVRSPRARTKIRQWFSRERREDALETGRDLLRRALRRQSLPIVRLSSDELMSRVATDLRCPNLEALYVAIGEGHVSPQSVVSRLTRLVSEEAEEEGEEIRPARPVRLGKQPTQAVVVQGRSDVWVKLARCCTPVPGDGKATSFAVSILVEALDRRKLLQDVATVLGDQHVNIIAAASQTGKDRIATLRFTFELGDSAHLSSILSAVKRVDGVYDAYRVVPG